jgi:catecholate siderophore receptor
VLKIVVARSCPRLSSALQIGNSSHSAVVAATVALALFVAVSPLAAQETGEPPAAQSGEGEAPASTTEKLPPVTVETTDETPAPNAQTEMQPPPVVKVESDDTGPPKRAKKTAKAEKPKKPVQPAPLPEDYEPAIDPAESASASALEGASPSPRGGPSQIDGYIAKQTTTATKTDTPLKDIPQSVSITTKEQASDQGSKSLGQALTYVPGVNVAQGEGQRDQITIRGQNTTADFYVDGVRDDIEYYRDMYNVEAVEVVKGPNAMIFGRGGSGGVVNRATKQADGETIREGTVTYGMFDTKRATIDVGQAISSSAAFRMNAMYENSESYRDHFELERFGINPTMGFKLSDDTKMLVSYEYYRDDRVVDRGIPGVASTGKPLEGFRDTFFGNPDASNASYVGHRLSAILEHRFSEEFKVRSASVFADGDKVYANVFAGTTVDNDGNFGVSGYRDSIDRQTFINQTDWTYRHDIGPGMRNTIVVGTELSHQENQNFRVNARFDDSVAGSGPKTVSIGDPTIFSPVFFNNPNRRRDATLDSAGAYMQSQLEVSRYVELIGGIRFDHYDIDFNDALVANSAYTRQDDVWSPRAGIVLKPSDAVSVYLTYSKAYVPSVSDQLNFLNIGSGAGQLTGADLEPEEFINKEIGFKWEITPRLMMTGALFQLDRSNTAVVTGTGGVEQFGATRTEGGELGLTGYITDQWQIAAGFGHQIALVTDGSAATIGNDVASVPHNTVSLWNKYMFSPMFGAGLGVVHKTDFFASGDNQVKVDGYTRLDGALFFNLDETWSAQLNVENILNEDYFVSAHNNNNIMPGAPTTVYLTVGAKF